MTKKRVMIVEDSCTMRLVIRNLLHKDERLQVVCAAGNGKEALDKLPEAQPDLILLDVEMPVMDGVEFLRQGRGKTNAKIVVLSSSAGAGTPAGLRVRMLGADAVIDKPASGVAYELEEKRGSEFWRAVCGQLALAAN